MSRPDQATCAVLLTLLATVGHAQDAAPPQPQDEGWWTYFGVGIETQWRPLGGQRYYLSVRGSNMVLQGQEERIFKRHAEDLARHKQCAHGHRINDLRTGIENALLGARRYAEGVIECLAAPSSESVSSSAPTQPAAPAPQGVPAVTQPAQPALCVPSQEITAGKTTPRKRQTKTKAKPRLACPPTTPAPIKS